MGLSTGPEWTPTWQFYTAVFLFKTCRLCCSQFLKNRPKTSPKDGMVEWLISHVFPQFPTWCILVFPLTLAGSGTTCAGPCRNGWSWTPTSFGVWSFHGSSPLHQAKAGLVAEFQIHKSGISQVSWIMDMTPQDTLRTRLSFFETRLGHNRTVGTASKKLLWCWGCFTTRCSWQKRDKLFSSLLRIGSKTCHMVE